MVQPVNPSVVGTRIWDGTCDPDLSTWLGPHTHHYEGEQLVIDTVDGPVPPQPGYRLARWTDREVTVASPRTAERVYGPDGLQGRLSRAQAAIARVRALRDRWVKAGPPPLGVSPARWWDARLIELDISFDDEPTDGEEQAAPVDWPAIVQQRERELKAVGEQKHAVEAERDGAYRECAQLLALLASLHPSVVAPAPDVDEDGWQILYLLIGGQQASWPIAPRDADLYAHVQHVPVDDRRAQWDGHTTEQKYAHIGQHAAQLYAEARGRAETPADEQYRFATTWAEYNAGRRAALDKAKEG